MDKQKIINYALYLAGIIVQFVPALDEYSTYLTTGFIAAGFLWQLGFEHFAEFTLDFFFDEVYDLIDEDLERYLEEILEIDVELDLTPEQKEHIKDFALRIVFKVKGLDR